MPKKNLEITDYQDFTVKSTPRDIREKFDVGDIWSNKIQCNKCGWYIRSKNRHDYRKCKCGAIAIDGGSWYQHIIGDIDADYINFIEYYDDVKKV